jgi:poly(3-hydroxyalkanoate) synthetase
VYAALYPERVNTLTLAGAPVDFHAGGVLKGEYMLGGFIAIQPGDEVSRQLELLLNLDDEAHVERYREFEDWFKHTQDIPGAFYLWIVRHLFRDNELVRGSLTIGGERVSLRNIDMPLYLLAGATDHITPPDQVFAIDRHVATPPDRVYRDVTPGGHLGLFMGHQALREHWPPLLAAVLRRSR